MNKKLNILITGAKGQLGSELNYLVKQNKCGKFNFFFKGKELDITNKEKIKNFVKEKKINIIINCAAYTNVEKAEEEKEQANLVNNIAVKQLAEISKENNTFLIHISTDYVFNGKNYKPYIETDETNPINTYGLTKRKGEIAFLKTGAKGLIIRTSWLYSRFGNNFVKTMLKLKDKKEIKVIYDQVGTPTYARDLAKTLLQIIKNFSKIEKIKNIKIYHYSNEGVASWYDFAKAIYEIKNIDIKVKPIESKEYKTKAKRPFYSVLNKNKIKKDFNIEIPYWKESLKEFLKKVKV